MPNVLVHVGVQAALTRSVLPRADLKWIALGAIIPDLPWIMQRLVSQLWQDLPDIDARIYFSIQASLLWSLFLAFAISLLARDCLKVFLILLVNVLAHILLDAFQMRLGNASLVAPPFFWHTIDLGLFWPEDLPAVASTLFGAAALGYLWSKPNASIGIRLRPSFHTFLGPALIVIYLLVPLVLVDEAKSKNVYNLSAITDGQLDPGEVFAVDRARQECSQGQRSIHYLGNEFRTTTLSTDCHPIVSLRMQGEPDNTISVGNVHEHWVGYRDLASVIGLLFVVAVWARAALSSVVGVSAQSGRN